VSERGFTSEQRQRLYTTTTKIIDFIYTQVTIHVESMTLLTDDQEHMYMIYTAKSQR